MEAINRVLIIDESSRWGAFARSVLASSGYSMNDTQRDDTWASHTDEYGAFNDNSINGYLLDYSIGGQPLSTSGFNRSTRENDSVDKTEVLDEDKEDDSRRKGNRSHTQRGRRDWYPRRRQCQYRCPLKFLLSAPRATQAAQEEPSTVARSSNYRSPHLLHSGGHC